MLDAGFTHGKPKLYLASAEAGTCDDKVTWSFNAPSLNKATTKQLLHDFPIHVSFPPPSKYAHHYIYQVLVNTAAMASANPYQHSYDQPSGSHDDDLIDPDNGTYPLTSSQSHTMKLTLPKPH